MSVVAIPKAIPMSQPSPPESSETWTITCYACGMPSSSVWAKAIRCQRNSSKSSSESEPYFPYFLKSHSSPKGAVMKEDGTTHLCAFCFVSLEAQWNDYEKSPNKVHPNERTYNLQKFVCAVCGVETYRKRIRALPFQEFPFLLKERQPGSLTLGQNPLSIVCLDCSETLWAQSAEYDRWGLPVHKRHFNWMARPPPPENSMEATVARLPSGETQLPRCPPVEPSVTAEGKIIHTSTFTPFAQSVQCDIKNTKNDANRKKSTGNINMGRKPPIPSIDENQFPPVVTVAPMSSHKNIISMRKGSITSPTNEASENSKRDIDARNNSHGLLSQALTGPFVGKNSAATVEHYNGYQWHPQESSYSYSNLDTSLNNPTVSGNPWPWIPNSSPAELLNYQTYLSSLAACRRYGVPEPYLASSQPVYSSVVQSSLQNPTMLSNSPYSQAAASYHSPHHDWPPSSNFNVNNVPNYDEPQAVALDCCTIPQTLNTSTTFNIHATNTFERDSQKRKLSNSATQPSNDGASTNLSVVKSSAPCKTSFQGVAVGRTRKISIVVDSAEHSNSAKTYSSEISKINRPEKVQMNSKPPSGNLGVVDLRKKSEAGLNPPEKVSTSTRSRSSSFSIAYLCNESSHCLSEPPISSSQESSSRSSVIVSTSDTPNRVEYRKKSNSISVADKSVNIVPVSVPQIGPGNSERENIISAVSINRSYKAHGEIKLPPKKDRRNISPDLESNVIEEKDSQQEATELLKINIEKDKHLVERTLKEHKREEILRENITKAENKKKEEFLKQFELVTPKEVSEIELRKTISRAEKKTLPPLKLRPSSPKSNSDDEDCRLQKETTLAISRFGQNNSFVLTKEQQAFLEQLGLKWNSPKERLTKDQQWCLILAEKVLRRLRHKSVSYNRRKRSFENSSLTDSLVPLTKICRIDTLTPDTNKKGIQPMKNLSVVLASETDAMSKPWLLNSSDLLSIVGSVENYKDTENGSEDVSTLRVQPVISYPKYIPSYVTAHNTNEDTQKGQDENGIGNRKDLNILNVPVPSLSTLRHSIAPQDTGLSLNSSPSTPKISTLNLPKTSTFGPSHSENHNGDTDNGNSRTSNAIDSAETETKEAQNETILNPTSTNNKELENAKYSKMDSIINRCNEFWKGMQSEIDNILTSAEAQKTNGYFVVDEMRKLRKALTNYQSEMKTAERKLRMKEQEVSNNKSVVPTTNGVVIVNGVIGKNTQSNCRKVSEQSKGI